MTRPERPIVVWDGDCGFCRRSVERLRSELGDALDYAPYQEVGARFAPLGPSEFARAVHLIEPDGRAASGAEAVFRALARRERGMPWLWLYEHVGPFAFLAERAYRVVASHRRATSQILRALVGPDLLPLRFALTRWLYLRSLALVALAACLSLAVQQDGLNGSGGILPSGEYLAAVKEAYAAEPAVARWLALPTLLWIDASDAAQHALAGVGIAASLALLLDVAPAAALLALWAAYLSLVRAGSVFWSFQWDALLLEALLVSLPLAPWRLAPRPPWRAPPAGRDPEPPLAAVWLVRLLVFKLMLLSGVVKLASGDPTWRGLRALRFHFFTQPLPTWTAYWMHQLPAPLLALACAAVLAVELGAPWLMLGPRRPRAWGCAATLALMAGIAATGNYGFFNALTAALALMLLDDARLARLPGLRRLAPVSAPLERAAPRARGLAAALALGWLGLSALAVLARFEPDPPGRDLAAAASSLGAASTYGLFADMTTERGEIEIEGSRDGATWSAYGFRWKPGPLERAGAFTGLHMPRLDWQLWFASLQGCARAPWIWALARGLLEARPAVRGLLAADPFGDDPPRLIRMTIAPYTFSDRAERAHSGHAWQRGPSASFCPTFTLRDGSLALAEP